MGSGAVSGLSNIAARSIVTRGVQLCISLGLVACVVFSSCVCGWVLIGVGGIVVVIYRSGSVNNSEWI